MLLSFKKEDSSSFLGGRWQRTFAFWVALGGGSGAFPWAPGTAGSLVGLVLGLMLFHVSPLALAGGALIATIGGLAAIRATLPGAEADADPGWIVIDEVAGQMIALLGLHRISLLGALLAFGLFRLFDVAKPGPVGWADRQGGAAGIMADDVIAGALAALCLLAVQALHLLG